MSSRGGRSHWTAAWLHSVTPLSPFAGVMEWVSAEDASRLLVNLCDVGVPEQFWQGIYNIGGGEPWRLTNWELQTEMSAAMGVRDIRKWYERNWFATRNFHGQWYTDSDRLEELVPFRRDNFQAALRRAVLAAPASVRNAGRVPAWIVEHLVLSPLTRRHRGTMGYVRSADEDVPPEQWTLAVMAAVAEFRGGAVRSAAMNVGDVATALAWRCAFGHEFTGSPRLILTGGHCDVAGYRDQAVRNPFLAQLEAGG